MEILITKDYGKFSFLPWNRALNQKGINKIKASIEKDGYRMFEPILVDSNFKIIDGQHRFEVCKELEIPIYYVVICEEATPDLVRSMNTDKTKWTANDLIHQKAETDFPILRTVENIARVYGVSNIKVVRICCALGRFDQKCGNIQNIHFFVQHLTSDILDKDVDVLQGLKDISDICRFYKDDKFISAYTRAFLSKNFDKKRFSRALNSRHIEPCGTTEQYKRQIEDVYNNSIHGANKENLIIRIA